MTHTPTPQAHTFCPTAIQIHAARTLFTAMAHAELVTPIVEAYQNEILARHQWPKAEEWAHIGPLRMGHSEFCGELVLNDKHAFLLGEEHFVEYLAECAIAQKHAGLKTIDPNHCPKLEAQNLVRKAEMLLVGSMSSLTGMNWGELCGSPSVMREYIDRSLSLLAHYVGTVEEVLSSTQPRSVENFDLVCPSTNYDIQIDTARLVGSFEHTSVVDGCSGRLWFAQLENNRLDLVDYDGVFAVPVAVCHALRAAGIRVDTSCWACRVVPGLLDAPKTITTGGRVFGVVAAFPESDEDQANEYMEANPGASLLLIADGLIYLSNTTDRGVPA